MDLIMEPMLSAREREVLDRIAHGHKGHEIARVLEIGERTVRFHVENILDKLGVRNRTEAVYCAFRNGWIYD
jgi:DNA-binding NarL/FixJ family response regulator